MTPCQNCNEAFHKKNISNYRREIKIAAANGKNWFFHWEHQQSFVFWWGPNSLKLICPHFSFWNCLSDCRNGTKKVKSCIWSWIYTRKPKAVEVVFKKFGMKDKSFTNLSVFHLWRVPGFNNWKDITEIYKILKYMSYS